MVDPLSGRTAPEHTRIRVLGALVLEASLSKLGFGLLGFALPLYARSFGMSVSSIGVLLSTNLIVAAACKPIVGGLVDRVGHARAALIASTARVAVFVLLLLAPGPTLLWAAQLLRGLAKSVRDPALNALVATNGGKKTMATAFAWYGTAKSVASSAGKALAGVVLGAVAGYTAVFALGLLLAAAATATIATRRSGLDAVPNPVEPPEPQDGSGPGRPECAAISSRHIAGALLPWLAFGGAVSATARMLHGLLPLLAVEYAGLSTAVAGSIYLVPTVVIAVTGPAFGWLGDRVDHRFVLGVRSLANVMSSLIMLVAPSGSGFAAGKAIDALGNAAFTPAWGALMADAAAGHPHDRARVMAIMTSARDVGTIVGPVLGGLVWGAFGPVALLVIRAVLSAGTEALAVVANRTDDRADDR
ncbi:MAG: MFS transporter [Actinomycetota bacterium]